MNVRCTSLLSEEALSKVKFDKNEIMMSLKNYHSYDELYEKASSSIVSFAKGMFLHWLQNVSSFAWLLYKTNPHLFNFDPDRFNWHRC